MYFLIGALPLNLNFIEILIHLVNLAILIVAVRFLLYKPIKRFIEKRSNEYRRQEQECEDNMRKAENLKLEYEALLSESKQSVLAVTESATRSAKTHADEIIREAQNKANKILRGADEEIARKIEEEEKRLKLSTVDLAYSMASEILSREIAEQDIDNQLNEIIGKW